MRVCVSREAVNTLDGEVTGLGIVDLNCFCQKRAADLGDGQPLMLSDLL
jgi:hypothetical protein